MRSDKPSVDDDPGYTAAQLDAVADELQFVVDRFRSAASLMRELEFDDLHIKAKTSFGMNLDTLILLAGKCESEVRSQAKHAKQGTIPPWKLHKIKVRNREAAASNLASLESEELIKPEVPPPPLGRQKPAKKPAKKSVKKGST